MYDRNIPYIAKNKAAIMSRSRILDSIQPEETGYLRINVFRYQSRRPVVNASVSISKLVIGGYYRESGAGFFITSDLTDESGSAPVFALSVLTNLNETYNAAVIADGFCPAYIVGVPIYPGITTTYNVYLRDADIDDEPHFHFIFQPQINRQNTISGIF